MGLEEGLDENLQTHQSVDLENRIITFLFKTNTDDLFCCLNFSTACPDKCECSFEDWFMIKRLKVSCSGQNLTSIPLQFPIKTEIL